MSSYNKKDTQKLMEDMGWQNDGLAQVLKLRRHHRIFGELKRSDPRDQTYMLLVCTKDPEIYRFFNCIGFPKRSHKGILQDFQIFWQDL